MYISRHNCLGGYKCTKSEIQHIMRDFSFVITKSNKKYITLDFGLLRGKRLDRRHTPAVSRHIISLPTSIRSATVQCSALLLRQSPRTDVVRSLCFYRSRFLLFVILRLNLYSVWFKLHISMFIAPCNILDNNLRKRKSATHNYRSW